MIFRIDDLTGPEIAAFLEDHLREMRAVSPPESMHALDLASLRAPGITFWTAWQDDQLIACCALKQLSPADAEVKSMRIAPYLRGQGLGTVLIRHLTAEAKHRRYRTLYLETGAMDFFRPARRLYEKAGFIPCSPFGSYRADPNSVFMKLSL